MNSVRQNKDKNYSKLSKKFVHLKWQGKKIGEIWSLTLNYLKQPLLNWHKAN